MRAACCASTSGRCVGAAPSHSAASWRRRARPLRARPVAAVRPEDVPDWVRELEEHAKVDANVARLLSGTGGDPTKIQERMRADMDALHQRIMAQQAAGSERPMQVRFRAVDQFNLWVWLELCQPPSQADLGMLQEVVDSWFLIGRLGGYNAGNLQALYANEQELSRLEYDAEEGAGGLPASMHDLAPLEAKGTWARFWVDLGTADELAIDILINCLTAFSKEQLGIKQLVFGGENEDWDLPEDARLAGLPQVTMDPMRGPIEIEVSDEE